MATTGRMPSQARPAAKVTACCSAMPTSKKRSGCAAAKGARPVPSVIAAVIATRRRSRAASRTSAWPKTAVYAGGAGGVISAPVAGSNGPTPWKRAGSRSAGG